MAFQLLLRISNVPEWVWLQFIRFGMTVPVSSSLRTTLRCGVWRLFHSCLSIGMVGGVIK
jgi:hypothetical protein